MRPAYLVIIGDDEQNKGTISFLGPNREQVNGISLDNFISKVTSEIKSKN